jgi:hypothetical protein
MAGHDTTASTRSPTGSIPVHAGRPAIPAGAVVAVALLGIAVLLWRHRR